MGSGLGQVDLGTRAIAVNPMVRSTPPPGESATFVGPAVCVPHVAVTVPDPGVTCSKVAVPVSSDVAVGAGVDTPVSVTIAPTTGGVPRVPWSRVVGFLGHGDG